ncbi:MAG TPA: nuclear transport factor 2 family protein [Thermoanaerobaculia bacterium]|nr:nuclear transport factor 2 family protein [Thermoanaerobaculia bacterium]
MKNLKALAAACLLMAILAPTSAVADAQSRNQTRRHCSDVVGEVQATLAGFNQDLDPPNLDELVKYYHPDVVHYVSSLGVWFVGRDDLRDNYFAPFVATVSMASLDFSVLQYHVVDCNTVLAYGAVPGRVVLLDGTTILQAPLPQTVTFVRNPDKHDHKRPFVVLSADE